MISQKLLNNNKILNVKLNFLLKRYLKGNILSEINNTNTGFIPLPEKKPQRESYLKSLILGNINEEMFLYPELLSPRYECYFEWLKPIENYISNCTNKNIDKNEILHQLREMNLFHTYIDEQNFGINLSETESLKLMETLSNLPWLSTYMVKNHILPIQVISKYGSKSQKHEYYPKIMNGELIPSICVYEHDHGTNVNNFETFVTKYTEDSWTLNGKKQYVFNGINSNLFLVFAKHVLPNMKQTTTDSFCLFLVEKDFGNVACTDVYDTIGKHETPICSISFTDTVIPNKNMIGAPGSAFKPLMEFLKPGTQHVTGQAITILKNFMKQLVLDITQMKHFDRDFYQFDIVKQIIAKITITLYTMESMAYLTSGMIDTYEDIDANLEKIITETYCLNNCLKCIQEGLQLMGAHGYVNKKSYIQTLHNVLTLERNNIDATTYIGANMLQYIGKVMHDHEDKKRNFSLFPAYNIIQTFFETDVSKLNIPKYVHPSLDIAGTYLGEIILKVKGAILTILEDNGSQVIEQYTNLHKITELLTEIYALYANISRATRSYSIGVYNADLEKDFVIKTTIQSYNNIRKIVENIENAPLFNNYIYYSHVTDSVYVKHKYPMEHPLTRIF